MPQHSSTQKTQKKKPTTGGSVATRSQVTGRQLGRAALRALEKNANCIEQFFTKIDEAEDHHDLQQIEDVDAFIVARVIRAEGAGWFNVRCRDGSEAKVHVAGTIAFHGRAGTKTDRDNCIIMNDIIIVSGGRASAKLSASLADKIKKVYTSHGFPYPKHFFNEGEDDAAEDDIFDRSEEVVADVAPKSKSAVADDDNDSVIDVDTI